MGPRAGIKYNLPFGSVTAEVSYEMGTVDGSNNSGMDVSMDVTKTALHFGLFLDTIWPEPYFGPYVQGSVGQFTYSLGRDDLEDSSSSGMTYSYTIGGLIQLNWVDPDGSREALVDSGLNNTFLDIFITQNSGSDEGANFSSSVNWGLGVKLEF